MSKINVQYTGIPVLPEGYKKEELLERSKAVSSSCMGESDRFWWHKKNKCCCPEKLKFFFFWSNVLVINDNAQCPSIWWD